MDVIANQPYTFFVSVRDNTNPEQMIAKANPAIDPSADFFIDVGFGWEALDNEPFLEPSGGELIKITISAAETNDAGVGGFIKIRVADDSEDDGWIGTIGVLGPVVSAAHTLSAVAAYIDTEVAAIKAKTDLLPSDPADASDVAAAITAATAPLATTTVLATVAAYIDTEVAAIKAKTDLLPSDPADASDVAAAVTNAQNTITSAITAATTPLATAAALAGVAGYIDTEVAAIKAKTDLLPSDPADASAVDAAITAAQNAITTALTAANTVQAIAQAVLKQSVTTVEDSADPLSLAAMILGMFKSSAPSSTWTIYKTDGVTVFAVRALTADSSALPVTGVS